MRSELWTPFNQTGDASQLRMIKPVFPWGTRRCRYVSDFCCCCVSALPPSWARSPSAAKRKLEFHVIIEIMESAFRTGKLFGFSFDVTAYRYKQINLIKNVYCQESMQHHPTGHHGNCKVPLQQKVFRDVWRRSLTLRSSHVYR